MLPALAFLTASDVYSIDLGAMHVQMVRSSIGRPIEDVLFANGARIVRNTIAYVGDPSSNPADLQNWRIGSETRGLPNVSRNPCMRVCESNSTLPHAELEAAAFLAKILPPLNKFDQVKIVLPTMATPCVRSRLRHIFKLFGVGSVHVLSLQTALARYFVATNQISSEKTRAALFVHFGTDVSEFVSAVGSRGDRGFHFNVDQHLTVGNLNWRIVTRVVADHARAAAKQDVPLSTVRQAFASFNESGVVNLGPLTVDYEGLGSLAAGLEGALDQVSKLLAKPEAILLAGRLADFPPCVDFFRKAYNLTIVTCRDPAAMLRVIATQSTRVSLAASGAANISWKVGGHETVLFRQGEREACRGELALPHGENAIVVINGHNYTFSFAHVAQRMLVGYRAIVRQYQGGKESANLGIMFCSSPAFDLPDLLDAVVRVGGHGHRVQIKRTFLESIFSLPSTTVALASNLSMDRKRASVAKDEREKVAQFLTNMKGRIRFDLDFEAVTTEEERRQMLHELDEYNITTDMAAEQVEAIKAQFADVLHRYDEWVGWNPALLRLKKALDEVGSSDDEAVKEVRELYEVAEASNHGTGVNISVAELDVARKRLAEAAHEA